MSEQLHTNEWLCFTVEDEIYAHPVQQVKEILSYIEPVPVPGSLACIEGVLNVRGEIVTILSCRHLLGLNSNAPTEHIVILETVAGSVGITVDEVSRIRFLDQDDMQPTEQQADCSPIKATINDNKELLILTDFDRCVTQLENYE
ncbi:chemotaxis protein CheW [Methylophaga sp.]|uniref:chemotaxis protein CheW n=1 Tax=Methylophaga sp. TaxID=2024840 RepID=UPI003F69BD24